MILKVIPVGPHPTNCILLGDEQTRNCIIVDPGDSAQTICDVLQREKLHPIAIVLTHGHYDHVLAVPELKSMLSLPLMLHAEDEVWLQPHRVARFIHLSEPYATPVIDTYLQDGMTFAVGELECTVIHTPGHTKGSCLIVCKDVILAGDTLFKNSCGRCDLEDGDADQMVKSLRRIGAIPGDYRIYCGHGEDTTLDAERKYNPYLKISMNT